MLARHTYHTGGGRVLFKASVPTAAALGRLVGANDHVASLSCHPVRTIPNFPIQHQTIPNSRTKGEDAQVGYSVS
jgi:hypothetical protein